MGTTSKVMICLKEDMKNKFMSKLRSHQLPGAEFIYQRLCGTSSKDVNAGCILADIPGAGKCLTTFLVWCTIHHFDPTGRQTLLLLAPKTIISHWVAEFSKWASYLNEAEWLLKNIYLYDVSDGDGELEVVSTDIKRWYRLGGTLILTYHRWELLVNSSERMRECLLSPGPDYVAMDEFHCLRNRAGKRSRLVRQFTTTCRFGISATILQNELEDVFTLVDIVCPGLLGCLPEYKLRFLEPISRGVNQNASELDRTLARRAIVELRRIVYSCSYRCMLSAGIQNHFQNWILLLNPNSSQTFCYSNLVDGVNTCHEPRFSAGEGVIQIMAECRSKVDHPKVLSRYGVQDDSGVKLNMLRLILNTATQRGDKTIIFASKLDAIRIIARFLKQCFPGSRYLRLDGRMSSALRRRTIQKFNEDEQVRVFLATTGTGSEGISLYSANVVILYNIEFNPFSEFQAIQRINREGQTKEIFAFHLVLGVPLEMGLLFSQANKLVLGKMLDGITGIASLQNLNFMDTLRTTYVSAGFPKSNGAYNGQTTKNTYLNAIRHHGQDILLKDPVSFDSFVTAVTLSEVATNEQTTTIEDPEKLLAALNVTTEKHEPLIKMVLKLDANILVKNEGKEYFVVEGSSFSILICRRTDSLTVQLSNGLQRTCSIPNQVKDCLPYCGTLLDVQRIEEAKLRFLSCVGFSYETLYSNEFFS